MAAKVLVLNGPNLNTLGEREPAIYGRTTLAEIGRSMRARAKRLGLAIDFRQSNHEGELIDWIHAARKSHRAIIINPGGLTSTSISLMDALLASELPVVEVHISNIHRREAFRHHSYVSLAAAGVICGLGAEGYLLALEGVTALLAKAKGR